MNIWTGFKQNAFARRYYVSYQASFNSRRVISRLPTSRLGTWSTNGRPKSPNNRRARLLDFFVSLIFFATRQRGCLHQPLFSTEISFKSLFWPEQIAGPQRLPSPRTHKVTNVRQGILFFVPPPYIFSQYITCGRAAHGHHEIINLVTAKEISWAQFFSFSFLFLRGHRSNHHHSSP